MKKLYFLFFIVIVTMTMSCSSGYVYLNYPHEPEVILPEGVESIVVVNRSLTKAEDKQDKVLESVASGEIAGSDRLASDEAIKGVMSGIQNKSNIRILVPETLRLFGTGTRRTPDVLEWDRVDEICKVSDADVLLVLETFDSNSDILLNTVADQVSSVINTGKLKGQLPRQARIDVRSYWRLYDPYSKTIIDQFQQTHYMDFNLVNGVLPLNGLPETAYASGYDYISRFLPGYYNVKRDMYKKGKGRDKDKFGVGWRKSEVANWDGAIDVWKQIAENSESKSAGRAAHNIAVAYEVLGKTDLALEWAKRAYEGFGDQMGRDYAKILLRRKRLEL